MAPVKERTNAYGRATKMHKQVVDHYIAFPSVAADRCEYEVDPNAITYLIHLDIDCRYVEFQL